MSVVQHITAVSYTHLALSGIPEVVSYKWSVSDPELAELEDADSAETAVTFKGKGEVTVTLLVTYKDAQGDVYKRQGGGRRRKRAG